MRKFRLLVSTLTRRFNMMLRYHKSNVLKSSSNRMKGRAVGQVLADSGAFLKSIDLFDHMEFGVTSKDARIMPVATRKLIETTFLSLCDSGIDYRGKNVGCYMSGVAHDTFSISGHVGEVFSRHRFFKLIAHGFRMTLKPPDPFHMSHP